MFKFDSVLMSFVRKDIDQGLIPMLLGEPGIGKSSWLIALANLMHTKCFVLPCNQLADKADLTGARLVPVTDKNGNNTGYKQVFYPHAVIHDAIEYALANPRETPILFMDEINRTTPDVTSEALSIPTLRSIGSRSLPDNLRIVIAGNDKGNVTSLDEASVSRFTLYKVGPDVQTFLSLDPELNVFVKKVLQAHPEFIFCKRLPNTAGSVSAQKDDDDDDASVVLDEILDDGEEMNQITTPRTISGLSRWLNSFDNQELIEALGATYLVDGQETSALQEGIEGHVGKTNFSALLLQEIANGITSTANQANVTTVAKPSCYDDFKACTDMTALNSFIDSMTDNEKSGVMLYLLFEHTDNKVFIEALAPHVANLEGNDGRLLTQLASQSLLDQGNTDVLAATNTTLGTTLTTILRLF